MSKNLNDIKIAELFPNVKTIDILEMDFSDLFPNQYKDENGVIMHR